MASPGWYPDPNDASWQQFYDGHQWTGQRRPVGAEDPSYEPRSPEAAPEAEDDRTNVSPAPPVAPVQPATTVSQPPPAAFAPPPGDPAQQTQPAQQWGPPPPPWQQQPPQPQQPPPPQQQWQQPPSGQWDQPPWAMGAPPPRRRNKTPLIIALVVVVVAGLAVGGFVLFGGKKKSPAFTFDGKAIDQPDQALSKADSTINSLVTSRHGAKNKDTRCYFAVPAKPADSAKKTDIDHSAWCGPVLFVDGVADKPYLRFSLNSKDAGGGKVQLTSSDQPASDDPEAVPAGLELKRPDNASAPGGNGGLSVPAPPPADKDVVVSADIGSQSLPAAPPGAAMGTGDGGAILTKLGTVKRYGSGDTARSAPDGEKLIAFTLDGTDDDDGVPSLTSNALSVSVDGGAGRKLPTPAPGQPYVAAVPNSARTVNLVLGSGASAQTISLLNGKPGAKNIKFYARTNREQRLSKSGTVSLHYSAEIVLPDGSGGTSQTGKWTATFARLSYSIPERHAKASGPGQALLFVDLGYTLGSQSNIGFDPSIVTFTPKSGHTVRARNLAGAGKIFNVFDVPADMTSGTLHIAGSYTRTFSNANQTYTTTVSPINIAISIPTS